MRFLLLVFIFLVGCNLNQLEPTPIVSPTDTPPATNDGWQTIVAGLEQRRYVSAEGYIYDALRIDPNEYIFRAHYRAGDPLSIRQWQAELPAATVIINANFFSVENTILGLLISDGVQHGRSYSDRGGMFFAQADGTVGIRSNIYEPYQGENFTQVVQAFPMLVYDGQAAYTNDNQNRITRRTIIGQDTQGRVILMVTPAFGHGLADLSQYLVTLDLNLVHAFNLDGGGSTMMYRAYDDYFLHSIDPVPAVLAVYKR